MNTQVPLMQDLLSAGVHFGHKVSRGHPHMKQFIYGAREGVHIIDLAFSEQKLKEATQAAYDLGKSGKVMLVVATKKQAQEIASELAKEIETPYITARWVGGLLTNLDELKKNFKKLLDLKTQQDKGELSRYTKREQLLISRKLEKFERELGGVSHLEVVPSALFVVDAVTDLTAVKEGQRMGMTIIGLCDTNADPNWFDYPVPANDDGIKSIKLICETILRAYGEGKKQRTTVESAPKEESSGDGSASAKTTADEEKKPTKTKKATKKTEEAIAEPVAPIVEEAAAIEEEVEKEILQESERKVE